MGGLYITPNSTEMGWKRRGLRVSSEALLCLGVATIVASFVVDVNADGSKPNIWILIGGVIMIMAAAIGWSLTFCLIWETIQSENIGSDQNPKAPIHSIQVVVPETDVNRKLDPTYLAASGGYSKQVTKQKKDSRDKKRKKEGSSGGSSEHSGRKNKDKDSKDGKRKNKNNNSSKTSKTTKTGSSHTSSKTSRSSDYSRSTATTNTQSSSYTGTTGSTNSSSYDSSSYTSSEQRKSYV